MARFTAAFLVALITAGGTASLLAKPTPSDAPPSVSEPDPAELRRLADEVARLKAQIERLESTIDRLQGRPGQQGREGQPQGAAKVDAAEEPEDPPGIPQYTVAPRQKFREMIEDIERRIAVLQERGEAEQAADLEKRLKEFVAETNGDYQAKSDEPEIHVVGIHEPDGRKGKAAPIRVSYTGAPVILVLTAYNHADWQVSADQGVQLQEVIAVGYHAQKISAAPEGVKVTTRSHDTGDPDCFHCYKRTRSEFREMQDYLDAQYGRDITTFYGSYNYPAKPLVVGPESDDWRTQHLIVRMAGLHAEATREERAALLADMRRLRFEGLYTTGGGPFGRGGQVSWGEFIPEGPIEKKMRPLSVGAQLVAWDPKTDVVYTPGRDGLQRLDFRGGLPLPVPYDATLPAVQRPCGMTFDPDRRRVLMATSDDAGNLYSYEVDTGKWSVLASMQNMDANALAWSPEHDCLYGVFEQAEGENHDEPGAVLVRWTSKGAAVESKRLQGELPKMGHGHLYFMAAAGDRLVLLASPDEPRGPNATATHSYVINPKTGEVEFVAELKPQK